MEFVSDQYTVSEHNRSLSDGDVSYQSSVICYTRQHSAQVMMDFEERILSESSRIVFKPGDQVRSAQVMMDFEERILSESSRIVFKPGDQVRSAQVMMDFEERILSESSRIVFKPGDQVRVIFESR